MKILYHHRTMAEDGQAVHIRSLQKAFEEEGHEVEEVALVKKQDSSQGSEAAKESGNRWSLFSHIPRFARELAEYGYSGVARPRVMRAAAHFEPDFLYERYAFGNAAGVMASKRLKLPMVLEVNSPMVMELSKTRGLSFPGLAKKMERHILCGATRVCVVTQVLGDILQELGVESEQLFVTPNGVHLEHFDAPDRGAAMTELGLDLEPDALVLGFVGYYRDWHRLDLVVEALADPAFARAHLVLIGEGPAHEELVACAKRSGVEKRVHFAGPRPHARIPKLLPAFDIALVPAINPYASPLKLHEYMAANLAVVAPDQPNLRETLTHGKDALLVQAGDGDALCSALAQLASDEELRAKLGRGARATIEERDMTWRGNARRVIEVMQPLITPGTSGSSSALKAS